MLRKLKVNESKEAKRLIYKTDFWTVYDMFREMKFFAMGGVIVLYLLVQLFIHFDSKNPKTTFIIFIFLVVATFLEVHALIRYFHMDEVFEIETNKTDVENMAESKEIAKVLGWRLLTDADDHLEFRNPAGLIQSGENITLLFDKNTILINSSCYDLLSFGTNKKNITKFSSAFKQMHS